MCAEQAQDYLDLRAWCEHLLSPDKQGTSDELAGAAAQAREVGQQLLTQGNAVEACRAIEFAIRLDQALVTENQRCVQQAEKQKKREEKEQTETALLKERTEEIASAKIQLEAQQKEQQVTAGEGARAVAAEAERLGRPVRILVIECVAAYKWFELLADFPVEVDQATFTDLSLDGGSSSDKLRLRIRPARKPINERQKVNNLF